MRALAGGPRCPVWKSAQSALLAEAGLGPQPRNGQDPGLEARLAAE